jgi:cytochrome c-type biogenesis protein CcsB
MHTIRSIARSLALACVAVLAPLAHAQTAPEGNAHPQARAVNAASGELPNPFGVPMPGKPVEQAEKQAFARALNLEPIRGLAVFHSGRTKVLDTLARETVRSITGRKNYFEQAAQVGAVPATGRSLYDPLFTLLDLTIDPLYYADKPLIFINYLPLREAILDLAFPGDKAAQERWMKLQRITPRMLEANGARVMDAHMSDGLFREAMNRVDRALSLWAESASNMVLVAPASRDLPWSHISTLPDEHPARKAALELGAAWRARDAARANAAIATLGAELPKINAGVYPTSRTSLEMVYNRANAFEWGYWAYAVSLLSLLLAFGTGRRWLSVTGVGVLVVAIGLHAFAFITRCIIAERFAIQNQFESMTGISLFGAVVGLGLMLFKRQHLFAAAGAGLGFLVLITATQTGIPGENIEREAAILNTSILLKYHVTTVLVSYALITLGMIVSLFYLATHYLGRLTPRAASAAGAPAAVEISAAALGAAEAGPAGRERTLADLDRAQMTVLQLAFWALGVGILLGAWWADHSWGRWWAFDPKETWALLTWIVYLIVIHVRQVAGRNRALITAWLSVVGFIVMLWTYFGVNLLLPGLHAYA